MKIVGRIKEQNALQQYVESDKAEFVALYGRRRVGKTFLIKQFFKEEFSFYITGLANSDKKEQLDNFNTALSFYAKMPYPKAQTWLEAFHQLIHLFENSKKRGKKVIFIDELPWFDTPRSSFLTGLEYFWNSWASTRQDILLIVCGSATSWMLNKLLRNRGGLHNRVTRRMYIAPFNLLECEQFFKKKKIVFDRKSIAEAYMVFGGIPFYLEMFEKGLSAAQNVDNLCFAENAPLKDEFSIVYSSLFRYSENYVKVVQTLAKKAKGLTRDDIIKETKLQGGGLTNILLELEQCGFIRVYNDFDKKTKNRLYQLIDFYTLFYLNFVANEKQLAENYWTAIIDTARYKIWCGYAFEQVCLWHINQIKSKLGISGVLSYVYSWRSKEVENGVQIDLIIKRNDKVTNVCEMKFSNKIFTIDKKYEEVLRNKKYAFIEETKCREAVHLTMITNFGLSKNKYYGLIQKELTINDLFN